MPSYKPRITIYTDEETIRKITHIAQEQNRSTSNYAEFLIKKDIQAYEKEHGEIQE